MKIRNILASLFAIATISTCSTASAGIYLLGGAGITSHEYANVSNASSYKFGIGYMLPNNFGLEASYMNLGAADVTFPSSGTLSMSGTNMSGVLDLPIYPLVMSLKVGLYNIDANWSGSATSTGISWGFLLGYELNERTTLFMDTEGFGKVNVTGGNYELPTLITFGVRLKL